MPDARPAPVNAEPKIVLKVDRNPLLARSWIERLGVNRVWSSIADRGRRFAILPAASLRPAERARKLAEALTSARGEASGAATARELHAVLTLLEAPQRLEFYRYVAMHFLPDGAALSAAAHHYLAEPGAASAALLAEAAEPPRQELLRRMNTSPGGTAMLVAMRKEILGLLKANPALTPLDSDLRHLLASWFNRGFLELRRIDWNTPAAVLDKLIAYEAVHEIQGWEDLRRRLAPDRRCFGFFHPALPGEPLIFVEVALVSGLAGSVQALLARDMDEAEQRARAAQADTAIFYSISNCQDGLRGISFGNFLIKQVVEELRTELPQLTQFSTLSPIPGFAGWLREQLATPERINPCVSAEERAALLVASSEAAAEDDGALLSKALAKSGWWQNELSEALRGPLLKLGARYLTSVRPGRGPLDPVARFHLGNGARLERINYLGNPAARGMQESHGLMVNYLYDIATIEANHEAFVRDEAIARSEAVDALLQECPPPPKRRRFAASLPPLKVGS
jgi:malonyl-CoA decarboxylase